MEDREYLRAVVRGYSWDCSLAIRSTSCSFSSRSSVSLRFLYVGRSPDLDSVGSETKRSSVSSSDRSRTHEEILDRLVSYESLTEKLDGWFTSISRGVAPNEPAFDVPFELIELQKFDFALEMASFEQLVRMPTAVCPAAADTVGASAFLAIEDFLHASVKSRKAEKAISDGKLDGLHTMGVLLKNPGLSNGKWDHVLELALLRPDIGNHASDFDRQPSPSILGEALFYAARMLLSRSISRLSFPQDFDSAFILLVDSQCGGVVKVEGDVNKMEVDVNSVYDCVAGWIAKHCTVSVSPIDRIWNKLGNANWGDISAVQVLFATFHSIVQYAGLPKQSIEDLAANHGSRLRTRRVERQLGDAGVSGNSMFRLQQQSVAPEIIEVQEESVKIEPELIPRIEVGWMLWIEDSNWQHRYHVNEVLSNGEHLYYVASPVDDPGKSHFVYVGSHPALLEPAWEDTNLWYQVQRQTIILTVMKQKGLSSKYLPQLSISGQIVHPGQCRRLSSSERCDHPWCRMPVLVTSPVGETVVEMVAEGRFGSNEAIRCCHDCLSALATASSAGIRHGDIRPENIICVRSGTRHPYFVLIGWGHAILEDRDSPTMNLHYSSTYALHEGKLCSASDAESLVYMLYFACGGVLPDLDSVEGALQWRETSWSGRLIQQKLGDVSAVLKTFADYIDSLCGTPYPMDSSIWIRRLRRNIDKDDHRKEVDTAG